MNKSILVASLVAALGTVAMAQGTKPAGISLRAGIFWPTDSVTKNAGKTWFGGGIEYKLGDLKFANSATDYSAQYSISADWYEKSDYRNIPVLINYIGRTKEFYYFGGVGVGFTRETIFNAAGTRTGTQTKTALAYQAGVGYDFGSSTQTPVFLEAKYVGSSRTKLNGFGVFVGVRF